MPFSGLFGLDGPVRALRRALAEDRLAGAYLFVGPTGVGKGALAMAFAEAATCTSPVRDPFDACGGCESCLRAARRRQPEIEWIEPAGDQMQIWQFWDRDGKPPGVLQHTLPYTPAIGRKRVYVIDRADTLNEAAANSLLKVLEETPPYALFVLLSPSPARMLPTILSRTQVVRLVASPVESLAAYLVEAHGVEPVRARRCAALAEGLTGRALWLAKDAAAEEEIGRVVDLSREMCLATPLRALQMGERMRQMAGNLRSLAGASAAPAAAAAEAPQAEGRERVSRRQLGALVDGMAAVFRDLLALRLAGRDAAILNVDRRDALADIAATRAPEYWMGRLDDLLSARRRIDQNASVPLLTDWLAVRIATGR